jgi:hypothetical protein
MMVIRTSLLSLVCAGGLLAGPVQAAQAPTVTVGPVAYQTFAAGRYFHLATRTNQLDVAQASATLSQRLFKALKVAGVTTSGPILIIQRVSSPDPTQPFDMELGVLVSKEVKAVGEALVRDLDAFPCASSVVMGAFGEAGRAFEALFRAAGEKGRIPTGEIRELVLFWEGDASPNNMMQVQIGLQ